MAPDHSVAARRRDSHWLRLLRGDIDFRCLWFEVGVGRVGAVNSIATKIDSDFLWEADDEISSAA